MVLINMLIIIYKKKLPKQPFLFLCNSFFLSRITNFTSPPSSKLRPPTHLFLFLCYIVSLPILFFAQNHILGLLHLRPSHPAKNSKTPNPRCELFSSAKTSSHISELNSCCD
ncbi:hypothetical protein ACOSQ3_014420 [Xanthoceras sorbifolium]